MAFLFVKQISAQFSLLSGCGEKEECGASKIKLNSNNQIIVMERNAKFNGFFKDLSSCFSNLIFFVFLAFYSLLFLIHKRSPNVDFLRESFSSSLNSLC